MTTHHDTDPRTAHWYDAILLWLKRKILYRLARPRSPTHPTPLDGPVLIVGSAPVSNKPAGFDESFTLFTVNGSQAVTREWGPRAPDATFLYINQLVGHKANALAVRAVLRGQRTRLLYIVRSHLEAGELHAKIAAFDYAYDEVRNITRYQRMTLHEDVLGFPNFEMEMATKYSTGITAILYAFYNKAPAVIITGIDPGSQGHVYNQLGIERMHVAPDRDILIALKDKGFPLYTSDPIVARSLGLRLWTGAQGLGARDSEPRR